MTVTTVDLDAMALRSGEGQTIELRLAPDPPLLGGEAYPIRGGILDARVDVSRTTSGHALRLRAEVVLEGPCARCLGDAERTVAVDDREVEQGRATSDPELLSPYVSEGVLDVASWAHDALTLAMPEKVLCREGCAGLCPVCGGFLNDAEPGSHDHERPLDPRFAKLRELGGG